MAAKLEGGAFLSSFVNVVLNKLSSILEDNSIPERELFRRLQKSLLAVRPVLDDADHKQFKDQEVNKWLVNLQDALYMADDLVDELNTKSAIATQRDPGNSSWPRCVVDWYLEDIDMEHIVSRLESIVELRVHLHLEEIPMEDMSWRAESTSLAEGDVYGRDTEKEEIIEMLLDGTGNLSVISIEGMGGVGKTTLAQLIYNDEKVVEKFDIRVWVCVATKFDPVNVTKAIIEEITSSSCCIVSLNSLQTELKKKLMGNTFLVVLDDVWNNQQTLWDSFVKLFLCGNKGSKILLTTRNENVDSVVSTTNLHYKLDILSIEDCWSMFLKHSSLSTKCSQYRALESIGRKIVKKCKGLPLAVKTLGGLLRNKYKEDWNIILESEIWELSEDDSKIVPALSVSYHYLPSDLKQCFVYCSLYPEDYQFDKEELILIWMAEDLLQPMGKSTLEKIGRVYFHELVARSFFQPSSTNGSLFVMHDLMHDLATFFASKFYFRVKEFGNPHVIDSKTRHLSYTTKPWDRISRLREACNGARHMRTFLHFHLLHSHQSIDIESDSWLLLLQLKCLRVLSFKCFPIKSLPDSIGELIHLRYLDLSFTPIVILPESLCNLYNLQTLKLKNCHQLEMLPCRMHDLVNLRHLDIEGASRLKEMPKGMGKLKHLNLLERYIVGEHEENGIKELATLNNLQGSLCIVNLENVTNSGEAFEAKMGRKEHITILELKWLPNGDIVGFQSERGILEKLQPHRDLKLLSIMGYRGEIFPEWLGNSSYSNMMKLSLSHCKNCNELPSFGQLPNLQHLEIFELDRLEQIGYEFYKNDESLLKTPFKSLESLTFKSMPCWREWHFPDEFNGFPQLKSLSIIDCPVLTGDLPNHLPSLEQLTVLECEELACSLPRGPKLHQLHVVGVTGMITNVASEWIVIEGTQLAESILECLSCTEAPCLQSLAIGGCSTDISISGDYLPASLQQLEIWDCKKLTFSGLLQHKLLMEIYVYNCDSLMLFPLGSLPNLRRLTIDSCRNMERVLVPQHSDDALPSLLYLEIKYCPRLVSLSTLGLAAPHLEELHIEFCPKIKSFPEGSLPQSLASLWINGCPKFA
ncbi:putative disease resistance RPP13-like protein 1 isoform X1 [Arachis duranensis]|uniref:Disease resistance RPP13-like protein 1 isoform X1 n=2 Tax=Arachis duranensis TaxID=130453 RepID=A0A9C6WKG0_ARADU|nr:putative disease resistance RPP13-like protein 1 isoform X1 [Arachis duranensis]